ncbi:hypothetical protein FH608_022350 [Nonomuraea phyllanthi]|uniref:Uncharacterized protein n=1 Tax=Nonomuraea phyllanthi TaxID=2219224 RepID=A0A5C4WCL6_9ACTN|nr:hypothetical protein [Nonomuraea phyllanthi]KAB8193073.1 hypothetical protein FH608_022350 [Nonomuraea phyllanthi]QFY11065.1 hypothetical protein GBF35_34710 [Nonomuraea phyllanthi]
MSNTSRIALAVLAGYYLGRRRKLLTAAALVLAGLVGRARMGGQGGLLAQGLKALSSNAEVGQIADRLRGDLMEVGKAAAVAAAGRQIDSLSDKLHERAESLRTRGTEKEPRRAAKAADEEDYEEPRDYEDEDYEEPRDYEEYEDEQELPPEGMRRGARPTRRAGQSRR